jgi:hypothetical protein
MTKPGKGANKRVRNRGVPPPPPFDPLSLTNNQLITTRELAGWLRYTLHAVEKWRQHPDRGPLWVIVAGVPRYRMEDVRNWLSERATQRFRSVLRPTSSNEPAAAE